MGQKAYVVVIGEGFSNGMVLLQKARWLKLQQVTNDNSTSRS
jgi:hypothetical protein